MLNSIQHKQFLEQRVEATLQAWAEPFIPLRVPLMFNLRRDPYERVQITSNTYCDCLIDRAFLVVPAQAYVGGFLSSFKDYIPRQKAASFSLDKVMEKLELAASKSVFRRHLSYDTTNFSQPFWQPSN